ncbi:MAG: hypothetical protein ABI852_13480 [Gemmatimonadaceae bacterium]
MRNPSLFERIGEKVLLLLVGPLDGLPALYARGRMRFAITRAFAYATVMTVGLALLNVISGGPMFRAPIDAQLLALRLGSYWAVQFVVGGLISLFIWRMVERLAKMREQLRHQVPTT